MKSPSALLLLACLLPFLCPAQNQQKQSAPRANVPNWLKTMDKNGDGKIAATEATGLMKRNFNRIDSNKDGALDKNELTQLANRLRRNNQNRQGNRRRIPTNEELLNSASKDASDWAGGKVLVLTPTGTSETIRWVCTSNLPVSKMPKVCTYSADVGGPTAWVAGTTGKDACWDEDYGDSGGWVEGKNSAPSCEPGKCGPEGDPQEGIRMDADEGNEADADDVMCVWFGNVTLARPRSGSKKLDSDNLIPNLLLTGPQPIGRRVREYPVAWGCRCVVATEPIESLYTG